jgi:hypothetical protein
MSFLFRTAFFAFLTLSGVSAAPQKAGLDIELKKVAYEWNFANQDDQIYANISIGTPRKFFGDSRRFNGDELGNSGDI